MYYVNGTLFAWRPFDAWKDAFTKILSTFQTKFSSGERSNTKNNLVCNIMNDVCIKKITSFYLAVQSRSSVSEDDLYGNIIAIRLLLDDLLYHTQAAGSI